MPTTPPATPTTAADICTAPGDSLTVELEDLAEVDPDERLACFGDRTLILRGFVLFAERGGTCNPSTEPQWLVPSGCDSSETLTSEATQIPPLQGEAETIFNVIVHPEVDGVAYPWSANDHLEVTGSFDHPAALTCTTGPGSTADEEAQLVLRCRNQFVVTRAELVPGP